MYQLGGPILTSGILSRLPGDAFPMTALWALSSSQDVLAGTFSAGSMLKCKRVALWQ